MIHYRLKATPWADGSCHRVIEVSGEHTLLDVHRVLGEEFGLDDGHLWAFYLSGEFHDRQTRYGPEKAPTRLSSLLEPGMRFGYLYDFGDEHRFDLEVLEAKDAPQALREPRVTERKGEHRAYAYLDEPEDEPPAAAEAPAAELRRELVEELKAVAERCDEALLEGRPLSAEEREKTQALVRSLLDDCASEARLHAYGEQAQLEAVQAVELMLRELRRAGDSGELRALERRFAMLSLRHPSGHDHGVEEGLIADVRWVAHRYDPEGKTEEERLRDIPRAELERVVETVRADFGSEERLSELLCAAQAGEVTEVLMDALAASAAGLSDSELQARLGEIHAAMGGVRMYERTAEALSRAGERQRAKVALDAAPRTPSFPGALLTVAKAYAEHGHHGEAEPLLRQLLARRWLSGRVRKSALDALGQVLEATGRREEAQRLAQVEEARERERRREAGGTIVRQGEKVKPNDPCPCGSGKKAKKCCGVGASAAR